MEILLTQPHTLDSTPNGPDKSDNHVRLARHSKRIRPTWQHKRIEQARWPRRTGWPDNKRIGRVWQLKQVSESDGPSKTGDMSDRPNGPTNSFTDKREQPDNLDRTDGPTTRAIPVGSTTNLSGVSNDTNRPDNPDGSGAINDPVGPSWANDLDGLGRAGLTNLTSMICPYGPSSWSCLSRSSNRPNLTLLGRRVRFQIYHELKT